MKKIIFLLVSLWVLAACTPGTTQETAVSSTRVIVPTSTVVPATEIAIVEETAESTIPFASSILLTVYQGRHMLHPADPTTGQLLNGYEPIGLSHDGLMHTRSANGRLLAATGYQNKLMFVDVLTWQATPTDLLFSEVSGMAFSPNGNQLAITHGGGLPKLSLVDVATQTLIAKVDLTGQPRWNQVQFTPDGTAIVVYSVEQVGSFETAMTTGPVFVTLFSPADLTVRWTTELPDVVDGVACEQAGCEAPEDPRTSWQPALAMDENGRFFYIVHADQERLTTVDLINQTVQTTPITQAVSWLEWLLAQTAETAHAKEFNYISKDAVLSPDGSKLYVVGWYSDLTTDEDGNHLYVEEPLGLQVINTATGAEIARSSVAGSSIYLAPDGNHLLVVGWEAGEVWTEIVEIATLQSVKRLDGYGVYPAQRLDGQTVLLASYIDNRISNLGIVDAVTFEITAWSVSGYTDWLIEW